MNALHFDIGRLRSVLAVTVVVALVVTGSAGVAVAQDAQVDAGLSDETVAPGDTVAVEFDVESTGEDLAIDGIELAFSYDPDVLEFEGATGDALENIQGNADDGTVTVVAFQVQDPPTTPMDPAVTVEFSAVGDEGDASALEIDDGDSKISSDAEIVSASFSDGTVSIGDSDGTDGGDGTDDGDETDDGTDGDGGETDDETDEDGSGPDGESNDEGMDDGSDGSDGSDGDGTDDGTDDSDGSDSADGSDGDDADSDDGSDGTDDTDGSDGADADDSGGADDGDDSADGGDGTDDGDGTNDDGLPGFGVLAVIVALALVSLALGRRSR